jgi:hypothetical protein
MYQARRLSDQKQTEENYKPKRFDDYVNTNIVENSVKNNTKSFDRIQCNTEQYRNSFFNKTIKVEPPGGKYS